MRRLLVVLVALLAVPLVAAAPSALYSKPTVIVYPFTANGSSIDREASSRLATIIATQMANSGQVAVIPPPPGTERKDFLSVARAQNADYYIAGFISPLGDGVSVVEQVVSATSGIVVYSNTTQLKTYADAAGQGDDLALFVSRHANRGLAAIGTAPPASTPTPAPSAEAQANLGKLFGRRKKAAATPKPTPSPIAKATPVQVPSVPSAALGNATATPLSTPAPRAVAAATPAAAAPTARPTATPETPPRLTVLSARGAPPAGLAVLPIAGSADAPIRDVATARLAERTHGERATDAATACADHPREAVLAGTLAVRADTTYGGASANFELIAKDCAGKTLWSRIYTNDAGGAQAVQLAVERVVDAAAGAYLNPPKRRK